MGRCLGWSLLCEYRRAGLFCLFCRLGCGFVVCQLIPCWFGIVGRVGFGILPILLVVGDLLQVICSSWAALVILVGCV